MIVFTYSVTEHDPERPWIMLGTRTGLSLEASNAHEFYEKVGVLWPRDRFDVELAPGELMRSVRSR